MKRFLLLIMLPAFLGSETISAKIIDNFLRNKKLIASISSLDEIIVEIKKKNIEYLSSKVISSYTLGNTRYITKEHLYRCNEECIDVVSRYNDALKNLSKSHMLLSIGDGAILGFLVAIAGKAFKSDVKASGIVLALCAALLTIARNNKIGKVPYLSFPKLEYKDNYFGIMTNIGAFLSTVSTGTIGYFGTNYLVDEILERIF